MSVLIAVNERETSTELSLSPIIGTLSITQLLKGLFYIRIHQRDSNDPKVPILVLEVNENEHWRLFTQ